MLKMIILMTERMWIFNSFLVFVSFFFLTFAFVTLDAANDCTASIEGRNE